MYGEFGKKNTGENGFTLVTTAEKRGEEMIYVQAATTVHTRERREAAREQRQREDKNYERRERERVCPYEIISIATSNSALLKLAVKIDWRTKYIKCSSINCALYNLLENKLQLRKRMKITIFFQHF